MPAVKTTRYGSITTAASTGPDHNVLDLGAAIPGFYSLQEYQKNEGGSEAVSIPFVAWNGRKQVFGTGTITATEPAQFTIDQVSGSSENGEEGTWPFTLIAGTQIQLFDAERMFELMVLLDQALATTDAVSFASISIGAVEQLLVTAANNVDVEIFNTEAWRDRVEHTSYYAEVGKPPKWCAIAAFTDSVKIYDITDPALPEWMVFEAGAGKPFYNSGGSNLITSIEVCNDQILVGTGGSSAGGLGRASFVEDYAFLRINDDREFNGTTIGDRNSGTVDTVTGTTIGLVNRNVNSVAATELASAETNVATGMKFVTIAVATGGGVSVINPTGTFADRNKVVNSAITLDIKSVDFDSKGNLVFGRKGTTGFWFVTDYSTDSFTHAYQFGAASSPPVLVDGEHIATGEHVFVGGTFNNPDFTGLAMVSVDAANPTYSIAAKITDKQPPMWLPGGTVGAWLCDSVEETVGGDIVPNGGFDTDTTGWASAFGGTVVWDAGKLKAIKDGVAVAAGANPALVTEIGTRYILSIDFDNSNCSSGSFVNVGTAVGASDITSHSIDAAAANQTITLDFVATGSITYLTAQSSSVAAVDDFILIDNVSVVPALEDLSGNGNHLAINGTVPKEATATDADLVLYGPFTSLNNMSAPYQSDLDRGTNSFSWLFELKSDPVTTTEILFERNQVPSGGAHMRAEILYPGNVLRFVISDGTTTRTLSTSMAVDDGVVRSFELVNDQENDQLVIKVNGTVDATLASANIGNMDNSTAVFTVGASAAQSLALGSGKLSRLRIVGSKISDEYSAKIYEDERWQHRPGSKCTLGGSSDAITGSPSNDLATGKIDVPTADGLDTFIGFNNIEHVGSAGLQISSDNIVAVDRVGDKRLIATDAEVQFKKPAEQL